MKFIIGFVTAFIITGAFLNLLWKQDSELKRDCVNKGGVYLSTRDASVCIRKDAVITTSQAVSRQ